MRRFTVILRALALLACAVTVLPTRAVGLDLKSMILMPGPLATAHAEEEKQCESCHSSFDKSAQDALCLDCHEDIAVDRDTATGFHGRSSLASRTGCKSCHTDHKGRNYNIVPLDQDIFDHESTDFILEGKHTSAPCEGCHRTATKKFRDTPGQCYACHKEQDTHRAGLGRECENCHTPDDWNTPTGFDHGKTDFPLEGKHEKLLCSGCHAGEKYRFETTDCFSCHQLRDVHLGRYGKDCAQCHSQEEWKQPVFDHAAGTDFALTGSHRDTACKSCHFGDLEARKPATDCSSCHASSDVHAGRHGKACGKCHNTSDWKKAPFDHGKKANWPLTGKHQALSCLQCHRGSLDDALSSDCGSCHRTDDVHKSKSMGDCSICHQASGWEKTLGFDHELTHFPLEGMHATAACEACHNSAEFHLAKSECVDCHRSEDDHKSSLGTQCASCHTPNGWALWNFDHNTATEFHLDGAHAGLSCGSCHHGSGADDIPRDCAGCHTADDRHDGGFGRACGRCHSTESFGEIQWHK
ncbi:MAG: cytochrome C [Pseudomonadales bacterium]|nr:hypothetical protein [Halioglobus sp.]MCP5121139.1 cytochrome C [Pseudomonadales bacterium]MCP5194581.1 cytochrome C [Pseudomonadales bacterium]